MEGAREKRSKYTRHLQVPGFLQLFSNQFCFYLSHSVEILGMLVGYTN